MRGKMRVQQLTVCLMALAVIVGGGCAKPKNEETFTAPDGSKMTVDKESGGVKLDKGDTSASFGGSTNVTEADIQLPFYPGASVKPDSSMKVDTPTEKSYFVVLTTPDEPAKIKEFYESKDASMKFSLFSADGMSTAMATKTLPDGATVAVTAVRKKDATETEISLGYGKQSK